MNPRTRLTAVLAFVVLGLNTGCRSDPTDRTKANETKTNEAKTNERNSEGETGAKDNSFHLRELERIELTQGGTKAFEVPINRGAGFKSEVKFSLRPPREAKGITFTPADWMLNSNENSMTVTARAAPDASVGTFSWALIVRPRVGQEFTRTLTVVVGPRG